MEKPIVSNGGYKGELKHAIQRIDTYDVVTWELFLLHGATLQPSGL